MATASTQLVWFLSMSHLGRVHSGLDDFTRALKLSLLGTPTARGGWLMVNVDDLLSELQVARSLLIGW